MQKCVGTMRRLYFILKTTSWLLLVGALITSCAPAQGVQTKVMKDAPTALPPYQVGPDDELQVFVWKQPQISGRVVVAADGTVTVPLAGQIYAAGLTAKQLQAEVAKRLATYMSDPTVTVRVDNARSQVFYVVGKVGKPGVFRLRPGEVLSQALAEAGGLNEFADADHVRIARRSRTETEEISVNYVRVQEGKDLSADISLMAGDTITVP
jgi:polysaccharide biosynthesis/export protein